MKRITAICALISSLSFGQAQSFEFSSVEEIYASSFGLGSIQTLLGTILWSAPPQDREVQWLQSTGTQYLLFAPSSITTGIDIWILPQQQTTGSGDVGTWNGSSRANSIVFDNRTVNGVYRGFTISNAGGRGASGSSVYSGLTRAYRHVTVFGADATIDTNSYTLKTAWGAYTSGDFKKFSLFGCYNTSTATVNCKSSRIGPCKLYTGTNGSTLAYDLVPYVKDGVGCMYDKLSDTYFYNQGTGEFIIGPDL